MKVDDNWNETRATCQDLESLLELPKDISEDFLLILENLILHKFALSLRENPECESHQISLPYLGDLVIHQEKGKLNSVDFVPRKVFYKKIKNICQTKESPLVEQCASLLGKDLVSKFLSGEGGEVLNDG